MSIHDALVLLASPLPADRQRALPVAVAWVERMQAMEQRAREVIERTPLARRNRREVQIARYILTGTE